MRKFLKRCAARFPKKFQQFLKKWYFASQIRRHSFRTDEPEYELSSEIITCGDWVLDIGANIGHYTLRFSELIGQHGRVIAFEPVPETFQILTSNLSVVDARNVTLINAAASDSSSLVGIDIPKLDSGLDNFYMAHLSPTSTDLTVMCLTIDSLCLPNRIRLVKIDAEGHDFRVLKGMRELLQRDKPVLFVEETSDEVIEFLREFGYGVQKLRDSPNSVFRAD